MSTTTNATPKLEQLSLDEEDAINDSDIASERSETVRPFQLVRNGYVDTTTDYIHIFMKLQLREDFEEEFFEIIKEYRSWEAVRKLLEDPENDLKVVSEDFLKTYGKRIWMYKGRNNKQDRKYRETHFKWKDDQDNLWGLLDELWTRVRQLLWSPASEGARSIPDMEGKISVEQTLSLPSSCSSSSVSSMDVGEEAIAVEFINKVRTEIHGLPGIVRRRKRLIRSIEMD